MVGPLKTVVLGVIWWQRALLEASGSLRELESTYYRNKLRLENVPALERYVTKYPWAFSSLCRPSQECMLNSLNAYYYPLLYHISSAYHE